MCALRHFRLGDRALDSVRGRAPVRRYFGASALLIVRLVKGFAVVDWAHVRRMGPGQRWMFLATRLRVAPFAHGEIPDAPP